MGKVSPQLLAACLDDLESGRSTVEELVAASRVVSAELRSLLDVAALIASALPVVPDPVFRSHGRAALVVAIAAGEKPVIKSASQRFLSVMLDGCRWPSGLFARSMGMPVLIIALVIALGTGGGAVYASQEALPGDALYQVKTSVEGLQVALASTEEAKANVHLDLVAKRLAEIEAASKSQRGDAMRAAAAAVAEEVSQAEYHLGRAVAKGKDVGDLSARFAEKLGRQQSVLAAVADRVPDSAKDAVAEAAQAARRGLRNAVARARGEADAARPADGRRNNQPDSTGPGSDREAAPSAGSAEISQLIASVESLAANDSRGSFSGLLAKLEAADAALQRGQSEVAVQNLDAFFNELNALIRSGHLGVKAYDALYAGYSSLVGSLGDTPKARLATDPGVQTEPAAKPDRWPKGLAPSGPNAPVD